MKISLICLLAVLVPGGPEKDHSQGHPGSQTMFACDLNALTREERARHHEIATRLLASVRQQRELANGYAFRLPNAMLATAAEWVALEARCCPFFSFELKLAGAAGPLWLHVTGPDGVKPFMRAEFGL